MSEACSGCGKPPHAGGCRTSFSAPTPPSAEELQRRRDYLASPEFRHVRDSSLAGRNPRPEPDLAAENERLETAARAYIEGHELALTRAEAAEAELAKHEGCIADNAKAFDESLGQCLDRAEKAEEAIAAARRWARTWKRYAMAWRRIDRERVSG